MILSLPKRHGSRISHVETVVFETDRDNRPGAEIPGVTNIEVDWDIDRAGSKSRVDIATHKRVLRDGQWIAPYLRITPEVGEIQYQQMGHFRLGLPTTIVDRSVDQWGDDKVEQSASGGDIADLLADASLPFTFYTPQGASVMDDVRFLVKLATMGMIGPNLIPNPGFEQESEGWHTRQTGGATGVTHNWVAPDSPAEGVRQWRPIFPGNSTVGGAAYVQLTERVLVPPEADRLLVSGFRWNRPEHTGHISVRFYDSDNTLLGAPHNIDTPGGSAPVNRPGRWERVFTTGRVPEGAAMFTVFVFVTLLGSPPGPNASMWDDIQVRAITAEPLPDDRINLPPSGAHASTRIQTTGGNSIGYDAINADRLAAIGHHALYTDLTGRLTTSPSRDLGSATVARTYREDDYRLVGAFEIQRSASNRYNTVTAVKESFEEGVPPLVVTVWNDDPQDPWSVHHLGNVRHPNGPLMVQDAVDSGALESAALATLARATMQHTLRIQVLHDPTLRVHDVIEIVGGPEEAQGRWLVEYIRPGMSARDAIVEIGARRTLTSAGVSGVDMGGD